MADDLDDFFAKKDKTRKHKKKGGALVQNFDENNFEDEGVESTGRKVNVDLSKLNLQDDGEWDDFEDEDNRDYSGLKIQLLNIRDKEDEEKEQEQETQRQAAAAAAENVEVWKEKIENGEKEKVEEVKEEPKLPPGELAPIKMGDLGKPKGPNLHDEQEFPDLSQAASMEAPKEESKPWKRVEGFSARSVAVENSSAPENSVGGTNRYAFLKSKPAQEN